MERRDVIEGDGPYRSTPPPAAPAEPRGRVDVESVGMLVVFAGACLVPVVATLANGTSFGLMPSLGLVGAGAAMLLVVRELALGWPRGRPGKE